MLVFSTFLCVQSIIYFKRNNAKANKKYLTSTSRQGSMLRKHYGEDKRSVSPWDSKVTNMIIWITIQLYQTELQSSDQMTKIENKCS